MDTSPLVNHDRKAEGSKDRKAARERERLNSSGWNKVDGCSTYDMWEGPWGLERSGSSRADKRHAQLHLQAYSLVDVEQRMAFPRNSLRAFLSYAKKTLITATQEPQKVTLVVGNESADLDSLTSSILYAYLRSLALPRTAFATLYIPLLNIPAADIGLRPEYTALFRHANISASNLVTLDDLPAFSELETKLKPTDTRWILVDHNKLQGTLGSIYGSRVNGVIDHHEEENFAPRETDPEPRIIEKSGSCTSLVVRTLRSVWDTGSGSALSSGAGHAQGEAAIDDSAVIQTWDAQIAKLALASILVDTANLTAEGKVFPADKEAVEYLEAKIQSSAREARTWDRANFHSEINAAKSDIDSLTLDDILRKDYKEWIENGKNLGISSVVRPLSFLVQKALEANRIETQETSFDAAIADFSDTRDLSMFAIMTASTSPRKGFQRELLLDARGSAASIAARFSSQATAELGLEDLSVGGINGYNTFGHEPGVFRKVWRQEDVSKSRKQVAPLLRQAMR